jgi:hypothetical protein
LKDEHWGGLIGEKSIRIEGNGLVARKIESFDEILANL